jgi:hypothetical protein
MIMAKRTTIGKATIKARLKKAGVSLDGIMNIEKDTAEVFVEDVDNLGTADYYLTEAKMKEFEKVFKWGGFKTGYGSWIYERGYISCSDINSR